MVVVMPMFIPHRKVATISSHSAGASTAAVSKRVMRAAARAQPRIAEAWEINDDASEWTFHLRKGAKWSDGEPITSGNVQWYYDNVLGNEELTLGSWPSWLRQGDDNSECTVSDDYTFTIRFKNPNGFFIWDLCQYER